MNKFIGLTKRNLLIFFKDKLVKVKYGRESVSVCEGSLSVGASPDDKSAQLNRPSAPRRK